MVGTFHHTSVKHLDAYLDELKWRFNNRQNPYLFRDTIKNLIESERVEVSKLTASCHAHHHAHLHNHNDTSDFRPWSINRRYSQEHETIRQD